MRIAIILGLCFFLFFSCSESDKDIREKERSTTTFENMIEGAIKYKIELLSLKYNISSISLKQELVEYVKSQDSTVQITEGIVNDKIDSEKVFELLMESEKLDIDRLTTISTKHNIPMNTLACILYDYKLWEAVRKCENP